jgi:molybdopterin-containing oxidoreductase family iron-sulfur binding subunit
VAGEHQPQIVHAAVALINEALQSPGNTQVWNRRPASLEVSDPAKVEAELNKGVDVLIMLDVNPVYDWPGGGFSALLNKAKLSIGYGLYNDETISTCDYSLPQTHNFESWSDAAPRAGLQSLCQPVIAPLYNARQGAESLLMWIKAHQTDSKRIADAEDWHSFVKSRWTARFMRQNNAADPQKLQTFWEAKLRDGFWEQKVESALPKLNSAKARGLFTSAVKTGPFEVVIRPHHAVYDGRFTNNGWLREWPDPVSKLVWDNAASISPATAAKLSIQEGDHLQVGTHGGSVTMAALIQPGMADSVVALSLGHGRISGGTLVAEAPGVGVAPLLGNKLLGAPQLSYDAAVQKIAGHTTLVRTQNEFSMRENINSKDNLKLRPIVQDISLDEYHHAADAVKHKHHLPAPTDLYEPIDYSKGHKWAMSIDLNRCTGCSGCMVACQAENNIPIVGKEECDNGREMHWIRLDRYEDYEEADLETKENPTVRTQPMLCQHCDNAPCENVCPVNATTHSPDGLNEMAYNRCVGTRYCSNNCPYKVRRFNFLRYQKAQLRDPVQELAFNPQVTVRGVGVMEKCSFCVQRINTARYDAQNNDKPLKDGAFQSACQQACPAGAIVFGDMNAAKSQVARAHQSQRSFFVLEELNVKPNVAYQARVRNPNQALVSQEEGEHHG